MGLDDAIKEIFSEDLNAANGASDNPNVRQVLFFGETVGTLFKHGVLDWDLVERSLRYRGDVEAGGGIR